MIKIKNKIQYFVKIIFLFLNFIIDSEKVYYYWGAKPEKFL